VKSWNIAIIGFSMMAWPSLRDLATTFSSGYRQIAEQMARIR
jgi:hypothetical protein